MAFISAVQSYRHSRYERPVTKYLHIAEVGHRRKAGDLAYIWQKRKQWICLLREKMLWFAAVRGA